ncbi:MAG: serine hydrolase [Planctomycetes bacterium]|nr:serine hydrolase [Planctomycetota bacterium]
MSMFQFRCLAACSLTAALTALFAGAFAQPVQPVRADVIDALMKQSLKSWGVPGAALAIVKDDRVIYLKGFGVREKGKPAAVTADTVFPIASCTKSFTALAVAMLADEGKMDWDDAVRKHLDWFRLSDALADANVTLRDLIAHRSGVDGHDFLWYRAPWTLEERIRKLGKLPLGRSFRSGFQYQAILVGAVGLAVGKAAGGRWEDFVRQRILTPLGMKSSTLTTVEAKKISDRASPHRSGRGLEVLPWYEITEPDPAGSLNSTARDLAQFIRFQLGDGSWQGKRLVSAEGLRELHTPQILLRREGFAKAMNPETHFMSYGMGWVVQDYRGKPLLMHGGAIDGFRVHFTLVPEARLGFVLLNNLHETQMNLAISNTLVDLFLGLPAKDWNAYFLELQKADVEEQKMHALMLRKHQQRGTRTSRALPAYAGTYEDIAYGKARVTHEKDGLVVHWSRFRWPLEHFHYDTFLGNDDVLIDTPIVFVLGPDGAVATLRMLGRDFTRVGN